MDIAFSADMDEPWPEPVAWQAAHQLAKRLRDALLAAGFDCDEVCAAGEEWGFLVEPEHAPIGLGVECSRSGEFGPVTWRVSATYEGGLSALWGSDRRRDAQATLRRIEAIVRPVLLRPSAASALQGAPSSWVNTEMPSAP